MTSRSRADARNNVETSTPTREKREAALSAIVSIDHLDQPCIATEEPFSFGRHEDPVVAEALFLETLHLLSVV